MYAPAMEPLRPIATTISTSSACDEVSGYRQIRNPAGIITTSLGNGMNELSMVMKRKMKKKNSRGAV